jgi:hypothetical protein
VEREQKFGTCPAGRLFYLALPPSVYPQVGGPWLLLLALVCCAGRLWARSRPGHTALPCSASAAGRLSVRARRRPCLGPAVL